jgi:hypothetical protein
METFRDGEGQMKTQTKQVNRMTRDVILSMVKKSPCSIQQISNAFSSRSYEVIKLLSEMVRSGQILVKSTNEGLFIVSSGGFNQ